MTLEAPWKTWKTPAGPAVAVWSPKGPQPPHCMPATAPCAATVPLPVPNNYHAPTCTPVRPVCTHNTPKWAQIGPSSPYHPHHRPSDHNHPTACLQQPHVQPLSHCWCPPTTTHPQVLQYGLCVLIIPPNGDQIGQSHPDHLHHRPSDHNHPTACLRWPHMQPPSHCRCPPTTTPPHVLCTTLVYSQYPQMGPNRSKQPSPPAPLAQ